MNTLQTFKVPFHTPALIDELRKIASEPTGDKVIKIRPKRKCKRSESVTEFLARGGKITKLEITEETPITTTPHKTVAFKKNQKGEK